nr:VIT family protein [Kineosporia sp. NBRC 101731]
MSTGPHGGEPHPGSRLSRLNWLRAGVLGANDGIVSTAGLVVGVAGATDDRSAILTAAVAGLVSGAVSMGLGEYVSVSSQRDSERSVLAQEMRELEDDPEGELQELAGFYRQKGLSEQTAQQVAVELSAHDAFAAHADAELHLDPGALTSPTVAAGASALSFTLGAALPTLAIVLPPLQARVPVTFLVVLLALALTGGVSATLGGSGRRRAIVRVVVGGALAMVVTYLVGSLVGTTL